MGARSCNHCCSRRALLYIPRLCVCSLTYPACSAHAPYCHLWPARLYNIFSTLPHKRQDFRKKLSNIKCVFRVPLQLLAEIFLILRRTDRDKIKNVYLFPCKVPFILVRSEVNEAKWSGMRWSEVQYSEGAEGEGRRERIFMEKVYMSSKYEKWKTGVKARVN